MEERELLDALEEYLIRIGLSRIPNARREREQRKMAFDRLWQKARGQIARLPDIVEAEIKVAQARGDTDGLAVLRDLRGFLDTLAPAPAPAPAAPPEALPKAPPRPAYIGRIAPTEKEPATPDGFPFWLEPGRAATLGEIVTADIDEPATRVVGVVQSLRSFTTLEDLTEHFLAHGMGQATAELPTEIPHIVGGTVGVLWREDGREAPPEAGAPIRRATPEEIRRALAGRVDPNYAVPAGFAPAPDGQGGIAWVPVEMDLRWLAGYEGGHINVAGISGVAAKTSYGLFLATGLLAAGRRPQVRKEGGLAVVAFNVKEVDLLHLDQAREWREAPRGFADDLAMWRTFAAEYLGDPQEDPAVFFRTSKDLGGRLPPAGEPGM